MHEYCGFADRYGFTPYDDEPDFDQKNFLRQWNDIRKSLKKECSYQNIRKRYPDVLLSKGTSRISVYKDGQTVYPLVRVLAPGFSKFRVIIEQDMPVYAPAWTTYGAVYIAPSDGMRRLDEKLAVEYLEWSQKAFGFFDLLSTKRQHLDIMILNDFDNTGNAGAIALRDFKTKKLRLGITLSYSDPADNHSSDLIRYEYQLFHELSHILVCFRYDSESSDKIVPGKADEVLSRFIPGYRNLEQNYKHEIFVDFLTEGMLSETEYEYLFCPHKAYPIFTEIAKTYFNHFISEI